MNISPLNSIETEVKQIHNYDGVNVVEFNFDGTILSMMALELPEKLHQGSKVLLGVNPSHVTISRNYNLEITYSNRIRTNIIDIIEGKLLCRVVMSCSQTKFESLITRKSKSGLNLKVGDSVVAFIKSSELFIKEFLDD